MSKAMCTKPKCNKPLPEPSLHCRCGAAFCSEACFISAWNAVHKKECPCAADITKEVAEKAGGTKDLMKKGAKLLAGTALSKQYASGEVATVEESSKDEANGAETTQRGSVAGATGLGDEALRKEMEELRTHIKMLQEKEQQQLEIQSHSEEREEALRKQLAFSETQRDQLARKADENERLHQQSIRECERLEKQLATAKKADDGQGNDVADLKAEVERLRDYSGDMWRDLQGERGMVNDLQDELSDAKKALKEAEDQARRSTEKAKNLDEQLQAATSKLGNDAVVVELEEARTAMTQSEKDCEALRGRLNAAEEAAKEAAADAEKQRQRLKADCEDTCESLQERVDMAFDAEDRAREDAEKERGRNKILERNCEDLRDEVGTAKEIDKEIRRELDDAKKASSEERVRSQALESKCEELNDQVGISKDVEKEVRRELDNTIQIANEASKEAERKHAAALADRDSLNDKFASVRHAEVEAQKEFEQAKQKNEKLVSETERLYCELAEAEAEAQRAVSQVSASKDQASATAAAAEATKDFQRRLKNAEDAKEVLDRRLRGECEELRDKLGEANENAKKADADASALSEKHQELFEAREQLRSDLTNAEYDSEHLRALLSDAEDAEGQARETSRQREQELMQEKLDLKALLKEAQEAEEDMRKAAKEKEAEMELVMTQLRAAVAKATSAERTTREQLTKAQNEAERIQKQLVQAEDAHVQAKAAVEDGQQKHLSQRSEAENLQTELNRLNGEMQEVQRVAQDRVAAQQEEMRREGEQLQTELESETAALNKAQQDVDEGKTMAAKLQKELKTWRGLIIEEQERSNDLQNQLAEARKARHEAARSEAAKQREIDRLRKAQQAGCQESPLRLESPLSEVDRAETKKLRDQLSAATEARTAAQRECDRSKDRVRKLEAAERNLKEECSSLQKEVQALSPSGAMMSSPADVAPSPAASPPPMPNIDIDAQARSFQQR